MWRSFCSYSYCKYLYTIICKCYTYLMCLFCLNSCVEGLQSFWKLIKDYNWTGDSSSVTARISVFTWALLSALDHGTDALHFTEIMKFWEWGVFDSAVTCDAAFQSASQSRWHLPMDDRSDFGSLEHSRLASAAAAAAGGLYGPSAAVAVNSGLMQLPSLGDTAGRGLSVMDRCPSLPPGFGCPPGLHADYSAMNALAQLHGWYRPAVPNQSELLYHRVSGS